MRKYPKISTPIPKYLFYWVYTKSIVKSLSDSIHKFYTVQNWSLQKLFIGTTCDRYQRSWSLCLPNKCQRYSFDDVCTAEWKASEDMQNWAQWNIPHIHWIAWKCLVSARTHRWPRTASTSSANTARKMYSVQISGQNCHRASVWLFQRCNQNVQWNLKIFFEKVDRVEVTSQWSRWMCSKCRSKCIRRMTSNDRPYWSSRILSRTEIPMQ